MPSLASRRTVLTVLAFLSGCCALAYEVLYVRALTTVLGDMLYVHAALLSTFLVGIAAGAKLARRATGWLWLIEVLTGLYALALPVVMGWLATRSELARITASPSLTIAATIGFLVVPSVLVGFSIPLFSAYVKAADPGALAFQGIYLAYNLGALLSILAVELLLVRWFGVRMSLAAVGAVNLANGAVLLALGEPRPAGVEPRRFAPRILAALALASVASAVFQMFFLKLTYLVFGPHRENFAVGLSISLFGIFAGAWLAGRTRMRFETCLLLLPLAVGLTYVLYLPLLFLNQASLGWAVRSDLLLLLHKFVFGGLLALGPMLLFGATIPALMRAEREVAGEAGQLLWISSLGNAAGYLVYVLVGHPALDSGTLLALVALVPLGAAFLVVGPRLGRARWAAVAAGLVLLGLAWVGWDDRRFYLAQSLDELHADSEVLTFKYGAESATLIREPDSEWISYNGHPEIEVQNDGVVTLAETISGVIPALGAPRLERALVLGLGTGITAGATSRVFERTDVVEINDAFYDMMPLLAHANLDIAHNPAARLHLADGRSYLVGRDRTYDAILNSIPAPTYYSASKIYTVEFYRRVARALAPDGVFCSWLASANMSEQGLETVLAAIRESFRHCDLRIMSRGYYMATCSQQPLVPRRFSELPVDLALVDQLQRAIPGFDLDLFFEDTRISDDLFAAYEPRAVERNTDDHPVLEFQVVRQWELGRMGDDPFVDRAAVLGIDPVRARELPDREALLRRAATFYELAADQFVADFRPLLERDPALWDAWQALDYGRDPND